MLLATKLRLDNLFTTLAKRVKENIVQMDTGQYLPLSHRQAMADSVQVESDDKEFRLVGGKYVWTYELGRGPTINPGNGAVRRYVTEYIQENNIVPRGGVDQATLAYFASSRIHESGSKPFREGRPTGVLSSVINDQLTQDVEKLLDEAYVAEIAEFLTRASE